MHIRLIFANIINIDNNKSDKEVKHMIWLIIVWIISGIWVWIDSKDHRNDNIICSRSLVLMGPLGVIVYLLGRNPRKRIN